MKPPPPDWAAPDLTPWQASHELALVVAPDGRVVAANPAFARKVGLAPAACLGRAAVSWCPPDEKTAFAARLAALAARSAAGSHEQRWQSAQGWRWIEWETTPVPGGLRLIGRDVSRHRLAEDHLAKLSQAVEQAPVGILLTSPTGHVRYMNAAYSDYSGFTLEDALESARPFLSEGHPSEASYRQFCATVAAGAVWQGTLHCATKDGRRIWERVMVAPAMDAQGAVSHLLCIRENITGQRELEEKLARAERRLDDELTAPAGDDRTEEAWLTLHGAAAWARQAATTRHGHQVSLARIARVSADAAERLHRQHQRGPRPVATVVLAGVCAECAQALRPHLPPGRSLAVKAASDHRVRGESWPWSQALTLAVNHFLAGSEPTVTVTVATRYRQGRPTAAARAGTVRLEITRVAGRARRRRPTPDERLFRDADWAFLAGVVSQAGGRIVAGYAQPWSEDLVIELPASEA